MTADGIAARLKSKLNAEISSGMAYVVPPPPLPGVGTSGDVTFLLEDRQGIGEKFLAANTSKFIEAAEKRPEIAGISNFMSPSNLQYNLNVNTEQATLQNMNVDEIYATIQAYMGSTFLNNFNIYGQEWQVYMQADAPYRNSIDKLSMFYVRNNDGDPVPLDSVINVTHGWAPEFLIRQNMFNSSQLNVTPAPGYSSGQVMNALDLITTSVLGTLGCDMNTFLRFFPAAETMYSIFVATAVGLVLLNWIWQLFKNFGLIAGVEAEDPVKLSIRSVLFIGLIYYCDEITDLVLSIGGTPYDWILTSELPALNFADFNAVLITILTVISNGSIGIIALILLLVLAWNYIKLLFEAAERYVLLGVIIYTAPIAFACGASKSTSNIFSSWCRMLAGQVFLLIMNAWCLKLFTSMVGSFLSNPLFL